MKLVWRQPVLGVAVTACAWLMAVTIVGGQTAAPVPILAEQVFKNVQVLKGTTVNEFMGTMGAFSAALGMSCEDCHNADDSSWANYAADNPRKQMARVMVTMMAAINKTNFRGRQMVTCYTCHRGQDRPKVTANLAGLYGFPPPEDPPDVVTQAKSAPTADQVFDKYIQAIGGAQRLAALRSFTATGVSVGYGPEAEERPVQIYARAPNQRSTVIQTATGNSTTTYDGTIGWIAAPHRPVDVLPITGQDARGPARGCRALVSGRRQGHADGVAGGHADGDRRQGSARRPGHGRRRRVGLVDVRLGVRPAPAFDSLRRFTGGPHPGPGGLFRLS